MANAKEPLVALAFAEGDDYRVFGDLMATYVPFSNVANLTGQPSMSVPLYWNEEALPIGVMFTGASATRAGSSRSRRSSSRRSRGSIDGPWNWMRCGERWGRSEKLY